MTDLNQATIVNLKTRNDHGSHMVNYEFAVRDRFGTVNRNGSGSFCVSTLEAVESQIRNDLNRKLGYRSFDVIMPGKDAPPVPKRPVLGVQQR